MEIIYSVAITINLISIALILLSDNRKRRSYFNALILINLLLITFHAISWKIHTTNDLSDAIKLSRFHTAVQFLALPLIAYTLGKWCNFKHTTKFVLILSNIAVALIVFNFMADVPIRFSGNVRLDMVTTPFGERISILKGESSIYSGLLYSFFTLYMLSIFYFVYKFFIQNRSLISSALLIYTLVQFGTIYSGKMTDNSEVNLFYLGGVPLTLLSLFIVLTIALSLKNKRGQLKDQVEKNQHLEKIFSRLAMQTASSENDSFYEEMLITLYEETKCEWIFIGIFKSDSNQVETKLALRNGSVIPNFIYDLEGSPCSLVQQDGFCEYHQDVANQFPKDEMLSHESIEYYLGMPLNQEDGSQLGLIVLLDTSRFEANETVLNLLNVFAARAGSEIRRELAEKKLKTIAYYDYLSKLPNRAMLLEELNKVYYEKEKTKTNALLLLIDLDFFGQLNRKFGFEVGEEVIKVIGGRLSHFASSEIFIARNHADEFVVLIKNVKTELSSLLQVQWNAIKAIVSEECLIRRHKFNITCSAGAVVFPLQISNRFDVLSSAEHALFEAKKNGRNQCMLFNPALMDTLDRKLLLQEDLAKALELQNELFMVYQPKVRLDGSIIGAEALIRWNHSKKGFISPAEFIPMAEESGLISDVGYWTTKNVLKQIKSWQNSSLEVPKVAINLSATQLVDDSFVAYVVDLLEELSISASSIEFELTESGLMQDEEKAIANMWKLRDCGISIALDDFGTGYSSLSYLQKLPLNVLKIDKSFIDRIFETKSEELVKSIISIAKAHSLVTVAEGTETKEQVDFLYELGCDYYQGYYFSKPLAPDDFATQLKMRK